MSHSTELSVLERIALFPVEHVLLPEEVLPLHIVEPRYQLLLQRVFQRQERMGINLLLEGRMHEIGCLAQPYEILRRYRDGRLDVAVVGGQRYRVRQLDQHSSPYWIAEVEWWLDRPEEPDPALRQQCQQLYAEVLRLLRGSDPALDERLSEARQARLLSFYLGWQLGLEPLQRQELLQMRSEQQRLHWIAEFLRLFLSRWHQLEAYIQRVRSNGHFPQ